MKDELFEAIIPGAGMRISLGIGTAIKLREGCITLFNGNKRVDGFIVGRGTTVVLVPQPQDEEER